MPKHTKRSQKQYTGEPLRAGRSISAAGVLVVCLLAGTAVLAMFTLLKVDKPVEQAAATMAASPIVATASSNTATASPIVAAASSNMAAPFVDGQIQFLVHSIEPLEWLPEPIQVIGVALTNTGTSLQLVSFNDQRLLGDQGREFSPDPTLLAQLNNGKAAVLLPPGGTATMRIPFALPINTEPVAVVFHAGSQVPGVAVPSR